MSEHTPGPWEVIEPRSDRVDPNQQEDRLIIHPESGNLPQHIAEVFQYRNHTNHEADGTALANARLIASAPKIKEQRDRLLEACEGLLVALKKQAALAVGAGGDLALSEDNFPAATRARAAIDACKEE